MNNSENLISVIVPVYNQEKNIKHCIESIINQTYTNLEIILVNDGSTDKSAEICDLYKLKDKRVKVIHKKNGGLADARNVGLDVAKGKYIGFVDSDDYIYSAFCEELYDMIIKYNSDISECDFLRINIDDIEKSSMLINEQNSRIITYDIQNNIEALKLLYGPRLKPYLQKVVVWNKLYKKELWDTIRFPLGKLHEDEYTMYKILYKSKKIISTNKIMYGYIQTHNSIMRQEISPKRINDNLDAYIQSSKFFENLNEKKLEMMSRRRYLENCIELTYKVLNTDSNQKELIALEIANLYKKNFLKYIKKIKENITNIKEEEIIFLLEDAYEKVCENNVLDKGYWENLGKIINENC